MPETVTRCANCKDETRTLCDETYEFALGVERDVVEGKKEFSRTIELTAGSHLDVNAKALQLSRDEAEDCFRIIGCMLTREQIETNIMTLKG